jgi:hypothetical protein
MPVVPLCRELGGVDADHNQIIAVALFELPQLWKQMDAVDSAVGPEVENHQLPTQITHSRRLLDVEPGKPDRKRWCAH